MLNQQQQQAKKLITDFIKNYSGGVFGLLGAGGTGKTYLITSLNNVDDYQFLAPTNKVTNILRKSLFNNGVLKPKVKTIDSYFRFKIVKDHDNKSQYSYKQPKEKPKVIIVDEVSMLRDKHVELLLSLKVPMIFLGDEMQIPPIENDDVIFLDKDGFRKSIAFSVITEKYELTIQNRQKENSELFKLINGFRNNMHNNIDFKKLAALKSNNKDILYLHQDSQELKNIISNCVSISFKNSIADLFNYKIGKEITQDLKYNIKDINIGDEMVFDKFYRNEDISFYTSENIKIIDIGYKDIEIKIPYREEKVTHNLKVANVKNDIGIDKLIWLPDTELREKVYRIVYYLRKKQNDKKALSEINTFYSNFMSSFARLKKPYAFTSHKSQGSTYENVIIPVYDFFKKNYKDANQLFYVALSRASKRVIFVSGWCNFSYSQRRVNFTEEERCLIAGMQKWRCRNCDDELKDAKYDLDHIERLGTKNEWGQTIGNNTISNLQALCKVCHKNKTKNEAKKLSS